MEHGRATLRDESCQGAEVRVEHGRLLLVKGADSTDRHAAAQRATLRQESHPRELCRRIGPTPLGVFPDAVRECEDGIAT